MKRKITKRIPAPCNFPVQGFLGVLGCSRGARRPRTHHVRLHLLADARADEVDDIAVRDDVPDAVAGEHDEFVVGRVLLHDDVRVGWRNGKRAAVNYTSVVKCVRR